MNEQICHSSSPNECVCVHERVRMRTGVCVDLKLLLIKTRKLGEFAYRKAIMNKERVQIKKYPLVLFPRLPRMIAQIPWHNEMSIHVQCAIQHRWHR